MSGRITNLLRGVLRAAKKTDPPKPKTVCWRMENPVDAALGTSGSQIDDASGWLMSSMDLEMGVDVVESDYRDDDSNHMPPKH